jgi:predicted O-methyltransferase YrrM
MIHLATKIESLLRSPEAHGAENDAAATERPHKLLNLERPTAELLYMLVTGGRRRQILAIGTSNGYSAIWLACATGRNSGEPLVTIERDAAKAGEARENLRRAGVQEHARVIEGDATQLCAALNGPSDCVFFDADRVSAPAQLEALLPKLTGDSWLLADNALSHPDEIAGYIAAVSALPGFDSMTVPVGKGLHIAQRRATAYAKGSAA